MLFVSVIHLHGLGKPLQDATADKPYVRSVRPHREIRLQFIGLALSRKTLVK